FTIELPLSCHTFHFFFNDTPTAEIYTLSLHDALPILAGVVDELIVERQVDALLELAVVEHFEDVFQAVVELAVAELEAEAAGRQDRKSTRLNSSHVAISYAVFCLKKKNSVHIGPKLDP